MTTTATKTTPATINLATIVFESEEAAKAAAAAQEKARELAAKADAARQRADEEQQQANRAYLELIAAEWPDARQDATAIVGETRAALEAAVREDGDVTPAYVAWMTASIRAWEVTEAVDRMRRFHGQNMRYQAEPVFDFGSDIGAIVNQIALELQQDAIDRIEQRRATYLRGATS